MTRDRISADGVLRLSVGDSYLHLLLVPDQDCRSLDESIASAGERLEWGRMITAVAAGETTIVRSAAGVDKHRLRAIVTDPASEGGDQ